MTAKTLMSRISRHLTNFSGGQGRGEVSWADSVQKIIAIAERLTSSNDSEITKQAIELRARCQESPESTETEIRHVAAALVREAVRRTTGREFYPVQIQAGLVLAAGQIAEMQTGEGKTLTSAIPCFLNLLKHRSVHVATPNSYLAERDCEELKPALQMLGVRVGLLPSKPDPIRSRDAYSADVVYGTGYEFGFDFLRDQLALRNQPLPRPGDRFRQALEGTGDVLRVNQIQRNLDCVLIDEIDSVLLDEAMTPLILSVNGNDSSGGLLPALARQVADRLLIKLHYVIHEDERRIEITDAGLERAYCWLTNPAELMPLLTGSPITHLKRSWTQYVEQALYARKFLHRDVDYVVRNRKIELVDQKTGRIFSERSWRAGLHQAVECREDVPVTPEKESASRITRQRYFRLYSSMTGMTGTASEAGHEFNELYALKVSPIPLNRPTRRVLMPDRCFASAERKFEVLAKDAAQLASTGRPVLIGTRTIADSERVSSILQSLDVNHVILNGKQDRSEAEIVSEAGFSGRVTIATNMAGRGTDIKPDKRALELGGLHVIGTERYLTRRVDRQLAGRSARAGAPGSAQFYVSADDELIRQSKSRLGSRIRSALKQQHSDAVKRMDRDLAELQKELELQSFKMRLGMVRRDRQLEAFVGSMCRSANKR